MKCLAVHQVRSALLALLLAMPLCGCVGHKQYNVTRDQYLQEIQSAGPETSTGIDLAVIEFDEFGGSWDPSQLKDTVELIRQRNSESENGVLLWLYVHGWMNDANPDREENDLARFRRGVLERFQQADVEAGVNPDHVVAVYVGWRGASSRVPVLGFASFWERRRAAERVASFSVLEAIVRLAVATRESSGGKVVIMGHSMGGLIVSRTIMPAASAKFISNLEQGTPLLIDQEILLNPAIEASYTAQIIEFLKRTDAHLEIGRDDGTRVPAAGPYIVSITSEADWVTSTAYELGLAASRWMLPARGDHDEGTPSQRTLTCPQSLCQCSTV